MDSALPLGPRNFIVTLMLVIAFTSCETVSNRRPTANTRDTLLLRLRCQVREDSVCALWGPSIIELIARPELYDGKRVRVFGFVTAELFGHGLFMSKGDAIEGLAQNGVWIEPDTLQTDGGVQPNQRYVMIEGTFDAANNGHSAMWSGAIDHVTRVVLWEKPRVTERH
jgi:hypothetical protein